MASRIFYAVKDSIIRDDGGTNRGSGKDPHNTAGLIGGEEDRTLIDFETVTGFPSLASAYFWMFRSTGSPPTGHDTPDNGAQIIPGRITADWPEGSAGADHLYSAGNAVKWPGPAVTGELSARGSQPASGWWKINVTEIVQAWLDGATQRGMRLRGATSADIVFDSVQGPSAHKPYLELTGGSNSPPNKPTDVSVVIGSDGMSFTLTSRYSDPDGDISPQYEARWTPDQK